MASIKEFQKKAADNLISYHNDRPDTYFLGNGIVGVAGTPKGEWTFEIGPDYTSPRFLSSERIFLFHEGNRIDPDFQMKRIRGTGIFFGEDTQADIRVSVFDFAPPETQMAIRLIHTENLSGNPSPITVCADITPYECEATVTEDGIRIQKDTETFCFGNKETKNWENRYCKIGFLGALAADKPSTVENNSRYTLTAGTGELTALIHTNYYERESACLKSGSPQTPEDILLLLQHTFDYWHNWMAEGTLPAIANKRDADALESLLFCVKMQQNRDGGAIAGIFKYANSYVRDTHGCNRMFLASNHMTESRKIILNIHSRWEQAGFIPNWWSMGSDTFIGHSFHNDVSEVTAYYMFMVRDYLEKVWDPALLETVRPSLDYAATAQLDWLREHDYTIDFNGDETEQYCCNHDGEEYGGFQVPGYEWNHSNLSFPSMTASLCALEWYSSLTGLDLSSDLQKLRDMIDTVFYDEHLGGVHIWAAQKSDSGFVRHKGQLTNYMLFPVWIGAVFNNGREIKDAKAVKSFVRDDGFLSNCPQIMHGFCGHTLGMFLDTMVKLDETEAAEKAARQILDSPLLSMYGTVSEFYGPSCVPNGHMCRGFEGGITGQALVSYFSQFK